ncbi:hypothetical protein [Pseudoalteromonas marina]|uniref:Lipoprotein n=1 Tax=Pseudoalteromonas marina TaxID=267375 RepID=A0ABT9FCJ2_9GAMM|nr:hypothetical protein [Pseudoalteromonas marina]KAF7780539.1 hypothetical protein PMAN_a1584 [Pseudoalteromonas marina]MDP2564507.1 hypothetical protein [Pseudoalteromonas marina]
MYIKSLGMMFLFSSLVSANEFEQTQLPFLSGAVYTMMSEVGYCGHKYPELKANSDKIHANLKTITVKIKDYYVSNDSLSKFESIEKTSVNIAGKKIMKYHSSGGISLDKCNSILSNASPEGFSSELKSIVDNLSS